LNISEETDAWFQTPPIGNGVWVIEWSRDQGRHVTLKGQVVTPTSLKLNEMLFSNSHYSLLWGSTVSYPSDSLASCIKAVQQLDTSGWSIGPHGAAETPNRKLCIDQYSDHEIVRNRSVVFNKLLRFSYLTNLLYFISAAPVNCGSILNNAVAAAICVTCISGSHFYDSCTNTHSKIRVWFHALGVGCVICPTPGYDWLS